MITVNEHKPNARITISRSKKFAALLAHFANVNNASRLTELSANVPSDDGTEEAHITVAASTITAEKETNAEDFTAIGSDTPGRAARVENWTPDECLPDPDSCWEVTPRGIFHGRVNASGTQKVRVLSDRLQVVRISRDLDTSAESVCIRWETARGWHEHAIPRSALTAGRLLSPLANFGLGITPSNARLVAEYLVHLLDYQRDNIPVDLETGRLGWHQVDGSDVFVSGTGTIQSCETSHEVHRVIRNSGAPRLRALKPCVDASSSHKQHDNHRRDWIDLARELGNYPIAAFVLSAGFLAPFVHGLPLTENPVVEMACKSRSGKTTMQRLVASIWSDPYSGRESLLQGWHATQYYFDQLVNACVDFPICMTDSQQVSPTQLRNAIYNYANREVKGRGGEQGILLSDAPVRGTIISSAETKITDTVRNEGVHQRIVSLAVPPFGENAALARRIENISRSCYGIVGPVVMKDYINSRDCWQRKLTAWFFTAEERLARAGLHGRPLTTCASIEAAAHLINEVFSLNWRIGEITDQVARELLDNTTFDLPTEALQYIGDWIAANEVRFPRPTSGAAGGTVYGHKLRTPSGNEYIGIYNLALERALRSREAAQVAPTLTVLRSWRDRGWIDVNRDDRHFAKTVRVGETSKRLVVLTQEGMRVAFGDSNDTA